MIGKPVLSQRRDLLEQPLDFYEPDVLPAAQPIVSKHYVENPVVWSSFVLQTWRICTKNNSKTNDSKVFKLSVGNDLGIS